MLSKVYHVVSSVAMQETYAIPFKDKLSVGTYSLHCIALII
jgi:hypothetical protein